MDGYTPIPDDAALKAANEKNMPIFKKGTDDRPEEVTESKDIFVEGLFTKDEVVSPEATTVEEVPSPVAAEPSPVAAEPSKMQDPVTATMKALADDPAAMADITTIIQKATKTPVAGGRRRTKHKKGGKKSHKKGKSSKKVAKRRKSRKTGGRRSRKQNKH
jgi:hypothetical protein